MAEVTTTEKQTRVRCSDEQFLEAVFSSKTYAEIAAKTGQKIASTMARYARTKAALAKKGEELPAMQTKLRGYNINNQPQVTSLGSQGYYGSVVQLAADKGLKILPVWVRVPPLLLY